MEKRNSTIYVLKLSKITMYIWVLDLMDSFIGRYRFMMRSRKWYLRIYYSLIDIFVINSWLVYKDLNGIGNLNVCQFIIPVIMICNKRGRPSIENSVKRELQAKKRRGPTPYVPPKALPTNNLPQYCARGRYKMPRYTGYTQTNFIHKCRIAILQHNIFLNKIFTYIFFCFRFYFKKLCGYL